MSSRRFNLYLTTQRDRLNPLVCIEVGDPQPKRQHRGHRKRNGLRVYYFEIEIGHSFSSDYDSERYLGAQTARLPCQPRGEETGG